MLTSDHVDLHGGPYIFLIVCLFNRNKIIVINITKCKLVWEMTHWRHIIASTKKNMLLKSFKMAGSFKFWQTQNIMESNPILVDHRQISYLMIEILMPTCFHVVSDIKNNIIASCFGKCSPWSFILEFSLDRTTQAEITTRKETFSTNKFIVHISIPKPTRIYHFSYNNSNGGILESLRSLRHTMCMARNDIDWPVLLIMDTCLCLHFLHLSICCILEFDIHH